MSLKAFHDRYEDILHAYIEENKKDYKLAELMSEMERKFRIPSVRNEEWEQKNRAVIALYRKISLSRKGI
jgi:hypothetical protein